METAALPIHERLGSDNDLPVAVLVVDGSGLILAANDRACRLLETMASALYGKRFRDLVDQPAGRFFDREPAIDTADRPYRIVIGPRSRQCMVFRKDRLAANGEILASTLVLTPANETSAPVDSPERMNVNRATHELQLKASALQEALEKQKQVNLMQRQFISMVSHEFRTPLAIIDGQAQRLLRRFEQLDRDAIKERTNSIRQSVRRLTDLIESLLGNATLDSGTIRISPECCDLKERIQSICRDHAELSPRRSFRIEIDALPQSVLVDVGCIQHILNNLISNAAKYSPDHSPIVVKGWREDGMAVVSVSDQGIGIPRNELSRIFTRFYRASTASAIAGTGIGLSLVKQLIELHGGTISVESQENSGSTFTFRLPLLASAASAARDAPERSDLQLPKEGIGQGPEMPHLSRLLD